MPIVRDCFGWLITATWTFPYCVSIWQKYWFHFCLAKWLDVKYWKYFCPKVYVLNIHIHQLDDSWWSHVCSHGQNCTMQLPCLQSCVGIKVWVSQLLLYRLRMGRKINKSHTKYGSLLPQRLQCDHEALPVGLRAWIRTRFIHCWLSAQFDWRAENACILLETIFREPPEIREKLNTVLMKHSRMVGMAHNLGFWLNLELAFLWPFLQLYNNCHLLNSPKFSGQKSENACTYDTEPV